MGKKEIPCILYLYIHAKLKSLLGNQIICHEKELRSYLFQWRIPLSLRPLIIKEMELLGLIKRKNRFIIEINNSKFNFEDIRGYYEELGLY